MKVKAIKKGYYAHRLRKVGEIFEVEDEAYFVKDAEGKEVLGKDGKPRTCDWMEPVDGSVRHAPVSAHDYEEPADDDGEAI